MTSSIFRRGWAAVALLALAACGHSAPTRFYTVEAVAPAAPPRYQYTGSIVVLEAVRLPPALDRMELMSDVGAGELQVREFERWAAAPARLARGALYEDLVARLPAGRVERLDARPAPLARRLSVTITAFHYRAGVATLSGAWTLACTNDQSSTPIRVDLTSSQAGHQSSAVGQMLGLLADQIVANIEASPTVVCPTPAAGISSNAFQNHQMN